MPMRYQVWPTEVEEVFFRALEQVPKLGRRKILVGGKPCGRNELIAEYIYRETGRARTRKQVSSHIQVLKNTRKNDPAFLKLLMDVDSDQMVDTQPQQQQQQQPQQQRMSESISPATSPITPNSQAGDMYTFSGATNARGHPSNHYLATATTPGASLFLSESSEEMSNNRQHGQSSMMTDNRTFVRHPQQGSMEESGFQPLYQHGHPHVHQPPQHHHHQQQHQPQRQQRPQQQQPQHHQQPQQQHHHHHHFQHAMGHSNGSQMHVGMSTPTDSAISLTSDMSWTTSSHPMVASTGVTTPMSTISPHSMSDNDDQHENHHHHHHHSSFSALAKATLQESAIGLHDATSSTPVTVAPSTLSQPSQPDSTIANGTVASRVFWPQTFLLYMDCTTSAQTSPSPAPQAPTTPGGTAAPSPPPYHALAKAGDMDRAQLMTESMHKLAMDKFPCLFNLYQQSMCPFLHMTVKMNLDLTLDGMFSNNNLFESSERRAIECATTIYSFGAKVLKARETKQAALVGNKFLYQFEFVNQFFNAFLKGVKSLSNWQEVALAMSNLSVVQVFTDVEDLQSIPQPPTTPHHQHHPHHHHHQHHSTMQPPFSPTGLRREGDGGRSPLLVMAYDFELGAGDVVARYISDGSEILDSLVC
ncbi:hypothetical protein DFQ27_009350 [Actinomortierella ambigua]|uniref:TEA domain-containing protein n=1 Tax=Actinomortierella ambigua TaxID=1343610 RepID=A0A9P6QIX5_9FUNG|nr:hypothetical protein DFQ27_009350 [Actinomortierella ambigua]